MQSSGFPLLDVVLTLMMFFGLLLVAAIIAWCLMDNFRRKDLSGLAKAGWTLLILVLPLIGCLVYAALRSPKRGGPMAVA